VKSWASPKSQQEDLRVVAVKEKNGEVKPGVEENLDDAPSLGRDF
jgi:hypothetical protein